MYLKYVELLYSTESVGKGRPASKQSSKKFRRTLYCRTHSSAFFYTLCSFRPVAKPRFFYRNVVPVIAPSPAVDKDYGTTSRFAIISYLPITHRILHRFSSPLIFVTGTNKTSPAEGMVSYVQQRPIHRFLRDTQHHCKTYHTFRIEVFFFSHIREESTATNVWYEHHSLVILTSTSSAAHALPHVWWFTSSRVQSKHE